MHRLGFITSEVAELCKALKENQFYPDPVSLFSFGG
jgi:hypothetical protein